MALAEILLIVRLPEILTVAHMSQGPNSLAEDYVEIICRDPYHKIVGLSLYEPPRKGPPLYGNRHMRRLV